MSAFLVGRYPERFRREGDGIVIADDGRRIEAGGEPLLMTAARLVQDDLVIMRPAGPDGYRLVAAALCFPSSWSLSERFGVSLDALHHNVPGYQERLAVRMKRIFDGLRRHRRAAELGDLSGRGPAPSGIQGTPARLVRARPRRLRPGRTADAAPVCGLGGDVLFTIRILVDPFAAFESNPDGPRLAASLRDQILSSTPINSATRTCTSTGIWSPANWRGSPGRRGRAGEPEGSCTFTSTMVSNPQACYTFRTTPKRGIEP